MKKLVLAIFILLGSLTVHAEEIIAENYYKVYFDSWGITVDTQLRNTPNGVELWILDNNVIRFQDARNTISTIAYSLIEGAEWEEMPLEELPFVSFLYFTRFNTEIHCKMSIDWLKSYQEARADERLDLVYEILPLQ